MSSPIIVNRFKNSPYDIKHGTFGYIDILGLRIHTVEQPWVYDPIKWPAGKPNESCIPAGTYRLVDRYSNRKKKNMCYLVNESLGIYNSDGPKPTDRGACMFHKAGDASYVEGCVGLGVSIVNNGGVPKLNKIDLAEQFLYEYIRGFGVTTCEIRYI